MTPAVRYWTAIVGLAVVFYIVTRWVRPDSDLAWTLLTLALLAILAGAAWLCKPLLTSRKGS